MLRSINKQIVAFITENASTLLTAGGVVGTVGTAVLTGRAAVKAHEIIDTAEHEASREETQKADTIKIVTFSNAEKAKLVWPQFVVPVASGAITIGAIVFANRISAQRAAALAAAYGLSQKQLDEYKHKMQEKLGVNKANAVRDEIAQDRLNENPPPQNMTIVIEGEVLCYDKFSNRYFKSTMQKIQQAEAAVNAEILNVNECSLGFFYDQLGLPDVGYANMLGWNLDHSCVVSVPAGKSPDGKPCLVIEFEDQPIVNYGHDADS